MKPLHITTDRSSSETHEVTIMSVLVTNRLRSKQHANVLMDLVNVFSLR